MGNLRKLKRGLNIDRVHLAEKVAYERIQLAKKVVQERASKDFEFAADLIKAVGENLPPEIKKTAEDCIAANSGVKFVPFVHQLDIKPLEKISEPVIRDMSSDFNPEVTDKELNEVADKEIAAFSNDYPEIPVVNNSAESGRV